jgi:hypothetical protein
MSPFPRALVAVIVIGATPVFVGCDDDSPTKPAPVAVDPSIMSKERTDWKMSSMPLQIAADSANWTRGTIRWHNPPAISKEEVYQIETAPGQGALYPLRLIFRPHGFKYTGGSGNPCGDSMPARSWGGIMMPFASPVKYYTPIFFDLRAKGGRGVLHFDFGVFSDDINGNGIWEDEDQSIPRNGVLDDGEDTGLDLKMDLAEVNQCGDSLNAVTNPDPSGDNWWFEGEGKGAGSDNRPPVPLSLWNAPGFRAAVEDDGNWRHYEWLNGTEGNIEDAGSQGVPDREALAANATDANFYFSIRVDLDSATGAYVVPNSGRNGWFTYQVPMCACPGIVDTVTDGSATLHDWSEVRSVRVWFEKDTVGVDSLVSMDSVWIAHWRLVDELADLYTIP